MAIWNLEIQNISGSSQKYDDALVSYDSNALYGGVNTTIWSLQVQGS